MVSFGVRVTSVGVVVAVRVRGGPHLPWSV